MLRGTAMALESQGHVSGASSHRKPCCCHTPTVQQMTKVERAGGTNSLVTGTLRIQLGIAPCFCWQLPVAPLGPSARGSSRALPTQKEYPWNPGHHSKVSAWGS